MEDKTPATMLLHTQKFLETKNFAYAMSAFCRARTNGDPIPEEILAFIEDAFLEWGEHEGKKSLDKILGINPGRGKTALTSEWAKRRKKDLFLIMTRLIAMGWKVQDAAEGACCWLQAQYKANPEKYKYLKPSNAGRKADDPLAGESLLDAKTLVDYWRDETCKKQREEAERLAKTSTLWGDQQKLDYQNQIRALMGKVKIRR